MAFDSSSGSSFHKTVELYDWWLTKTPETRYDNDTLVIGVAGLTFTSQQKRAGRCFHSAPILKAQDYVELETVDGVFVILKGFINKERTLENGFSPQVFDHFVFGFSLNWKEFATSCLERSAAKCVARGLVFSPHEDGKDPNKGHADFHDRSPSKSQQHDIYTMDMEVQDCEDTILNNKPTTVLYETPQEHLVKAGHEVPCERYPVTSEFEADSSLLASPAVRKAADSSTAYKRLRVSSRRMTRSMTKEVVTNMKAEIDDAVLLRTNMKACRNKEKGQGVASKDEIGSKKVVTRSKSRSKLESASSSHGSPKKQLIRSPKTRSPAKKASKEKCGSEYILSPESFSGKKSRSGRMLLPSLEFWRNQRVVYDEDGEVCGVEERV